MFVISEVNMRLIASPQSKLCIVYIVQCVTSSEVLYKYSVKSNESIAEDYFKQKVFWTACNFEHNTNYHLLSKFNIILYN